MSAQNNTRYRVFAAFAGAGARGILHVGALKALEEKNVEFLGLSGTSAGALVATLKAAGFTADELVNPEAGTTIMTKLSAINPKIKRTTDLFGAWGWRKVAIFRWLITHPIFSLIVATVMWLAVFLLARFIERQASRAIPV